MPKIKIPTYNKTQAENDQIELKRLLDQKRDIEEREKELKNRLGAYMEKTFEPDRKGHFVMKVIGSDAKPVTLMRQAKTKVELNPERAMAYLRRRKLTSAIQSVTKIAAEITQDQIIEVLEQSADWMLDKQEIVDELTLAQLVTEKKIPMDDFDSLCDKNVTYAMTYLNEKQAAEYEQQQEGESDQNATTGDGEAVQTAKRGSNKAVSNSKARK